MDRNIATALGSMDVPAIEPTLETSSWSWWRIYWLRSNDRSRISDRRRICERKVRGSSNLPPQVCHLVW
jgi:hypothetical protein